jgi:hypothetical protein
LRWIRQRLEAQQARGVLVAQTEERHYAASEDRLAGALAQVQLGGCLQMRLAIPDKHMRSSKL